MEKINIDQNVLKSESGLYLAPDAVESKIKNSTLDEYNKVYLKRLKAPKPDIRVAYNYVLTKAVPPKMIGTTDAGLIINKIDVDNRMLAKLKIMTENVSDEQEVLLTGSLVDPKVVVPGEIIKIDFKRYRTLNDDHTAGVIETSYEIPIYTIDGEEYLLLDSRDIIFTREKKDEVSNV